MSITKIRGALQSALDVLPGVIPAATILSSTNGEFVTDGPHNLEDGLEVVVVGHTGVPDGVYKVNIKYDTEFALLDTANGQLVESSGTGGTVKAELTQWQNAEFEPTVGVPYQAVWLMLADPDNPVYGDGFYRELGYMQIDLYYPQGSGTFEVEARADMIRDAFKRSSSFVKDDVTVKIMRTPSVELGGVIDNYVRYTIKVFFQADIFQ